MFAVAITGLARSGKDSVADRLVEKHGFHKLVLSDVLATELRRQGRPDTKMNRSLLGVEMREKEGNDVLAKRVVQKAKAQAWKRVVFSGLQSLDEVKYLKKNSKKFALIAVKADADKRFERRTEVDLQSKELFFERDKHNLEKFDLQKVIDSASHTIANNSSLNDLHKVIDELMRKI